MESELAKKDVAYQQFLERYNLKLTNEYGKKSEKTPGADEVLNKVELVLDEVDKKLLGALHSDATTKTKPKWKPLPATLPHVDVIVDIDEGDRVCDYCQSPLHKIGESSSEALEFVPAHINVIKTIRPKYTCHQCEHNGIESVVKTVLMPATPIQKKVWRRSTCPAKSSRVDTSLAYRYTAKKRCLAMLALN